MGGVYFRFSVKGPINSRVVFSGSLCPRFDFYYCLLLLFLFMRNFNLKITGLYKS